MKFSVLALATCLALLPFAPARAQNLLVNPGFDHDLSGWTVTNAAGLVTTTWSHRDAAGSAASGSLLSDNIASSASYDPISATQCVDVVAGQKYFVRAKVLIPSGQASAGRANVLTTPGGGSCAHPSPPFGSFGGLSFTAVGAWTDRGATFIAPAGFGRILVQLMNIKTSAGGSLQMDFDDIVFAPTSTAPCTPSPTTLCIDHSPGDARFEIRAHFSSPDRHLEGDAHATPLASLGIDQGGAFSFFTASNPEMLIKVLDGCSLNQHYWVFVAATTDVGFTATVRDSLTGAIQSYTSPDHTAALPVQATSALPCDD